MKATMELNYSHCSVQHFSMENNYVYVIRHPDVDEWVETRSWRGKQDQGPHVVTGNLPLILKSNNC